MKKNDSLAKRIADFYKSPAGIILLVIIVIMLIALALVIFNEYEEEKTETKKTGTERVQPDLQETEASKKLEKDLQELTEEKAVTPESASKPKDKPADKPAPKPKSTSSTSKINPYNVENYSSWLKSANGVPYSSVTFKMPRGKKPNLSGLKGDMGTILVPLASNSNNYVAVMYLKKEAIKKMAPYVKDLNPNVIPMTNKPEHGGRKWTTDASGTVYFFRDEGQQFVPNPGGKATTKLACYLGDKQERVNGQNKTYGIWLGWEVAQMVNSGVLQLNEATYILHRSSDNGRVIAIAVNNVSRVSR